MLSLFAISTLFVPLLAANQCNRDTDHFIFGLCYTIVNQPKSYDDARSYCRYYNPSGQSNLAVFKSTSQNNFLASLMLADSSIKNNDVFWIGLSRASTSSRFYWDDGTAMFWTNFAPGFPGGVNYVAEQVSNGKWLTIDSTSQHIFACSYDPFNQQTVTAAGSTVQYSTDAPSTYQTDVPSTYQTFAPSTYQTDVPSTYPTDAPSTYQTYAPSTYQTDSSSTYQTDVPSTYGSTTF